MTFYILVALAALVMPEPALAQAVQHTGGPIGVGDQFTWGNASTLGAIALAMIGLWFSLDKRSREERKVTQDSNDKIMSEFHKVYMPLSTKVEKLEDHGKQVASRQEVKDAVEHLKVNRQMAEDGITKKLDQAARDIIELGKAQARNETKHDGLAADVTAIKHTLETQDSKLDKMQDCLTAISVKMDRLP